MRPRKSKESSVERACVEWARERGILVTKNDTRANAGVPDRVFWLPGGRPLVVEFKRPGEYVEPGSVQESLVEYLEDANYDIHVITNEKVFQAHVKRMLKGVKHGRLSS